jgi:hypothetical protein
MLEHRTVAVPADPGAGIVAGDQSLDEFVGREPCKAAARSRSGKSQSGTAVSRKLASSKS